MSGEVGGTCCHLWRHQGHHSGWHLTPDGTTDLEQYLVYFEQLSMLIGWNRPVMAIMFGLALRTVAWSVLTSLSFTEKQNFLEVIEALKHNFSPSQQVQIYPAELKGRKRKAHMPLTELWLDIQRFLCTAYPQVDQATL